MVLGKREATIEQRDAGIGTKQRETRLPIASLVLGMLSLIGMMVSIWMIFLYAPTDAVQGQPQRIFYFHVPVAWLAMLGFGIVTFPGIAHLLKSDHRLACA